MAEFFKNIKEQSEIYSCPDQIRSTANEYIQFQYEPQFNKYRVEEYEKNSIGESKTSANSFGLNLSLSKSNIELIDNGKTKSSFSTKVLIWILGGVAIALLIGFTIFAFYQNTADVKKAKKSTRRLTDAIEPIETLNAIKIEENINTNETVKSLLRIRK